MLRALYMDNLDASQQQQAALRGTSRATAHTWIMSFLYIGTFGSFIGFSFAFGQVLQVPVRRQFSTPVKAATLTFIGPLLGSLIRPVGGAARRPAGRRAGDVL